VREWFENKIHKKDDNTHRVDVYLMCHWVSLNKFISLHHRPFSPLFFSLVLVYSGWLWLFHALTVVIVFFFRECKKSRWSEFNFGFCLKIINRNSDTINV
jgi:hypothetical protein